MSRAGLRIGLALAALVVVGGAGHAAPAKRPGVFVVGVDGMDPEILQRLMDAGAVPNLLELAEQGTFQRLGTSNPPQSPVAWSSFVTGMDPGGHGIFDFIHRDPATYRHAALALRARAAPRHDRRAGSLGIEETRPCSASTSR